MATKHGGCPVVGFDHNSAEHSADPVEVYRRLRAEAPVAWTEAHGGYWVVSDYAGVFDAARDDSTFASGRSEHGGTGLNNVIPKAPVRLHIPVELDLPEHRSYRKVINPLTSPAAVERMQPMIERWTTAFVDDVIEDGACDLASVIGVPAIVTIDWLGLDVDDWRRYSRALHSVLAHRVGSPEHAHAVEVDIPWMEQHHHRGHRRPPPRTPRRRHLDPPRGRGRRPADQRRRRLLDRRAAHLRRRRHDRLARLARPWSTSTSTPTSGLVWPSTPSCSTGPSRSSSASSRRPRRWPAPSLTTSTSMAAR